MRITMLGLNHQTASLALREKITMPTEQCAQVLGSLHSQFPQAELTIISTCNRMEIYVARPSAEAPTVQALRQYLADYGNVGLDEITAATIHRENEQAVNHLFQVAVGLKSMVLGEPQILGQVKRAYELAMQQSLVGPTLHVVFQQAITTAKQIRTRTQIDAGRMSVGSVAVDFAKQIFDHFDDKVIVGIGAGEMAKVTLKHMLALKPKRLWLANRSVERAQILASNMGLTGSLGGVRPLDDLDQLLVEADVVVSGTGAQEPIITASQLAPIIKKRRARPLFLIDIAMPRDIESKVGSLRNVYLYDLDDLQKVVEKTHENRSDEAEIAQKIVNEHVATCMSQVQHRDVGQLIRALREQLHDIGDIEQARTLRKLKVTEPDDIADLIQEHTHRVINKILHMPLSQLKHRDVDAPLGFYAAALRRLFQLDSRKFNQDSLPPKLTCPVVEAKKKGIDIVQKNLGEIHTPPTKCSAAKGTSNLVKQSLNSPPCNDS